MPPSPMFAVATAIVLLLLLVGGAQAQDEQRKFDLRSRGGARAVLGSSVLRSLLANHRSSMPGMSPGYASLSQLVNALDRDQDLVSF